MAKKTKHFLHFFREQRHDVPFPFLVAIPSNVLLASLPGISRVRGLSVPTGRVRPEMLWRVRLLCQVERDVFVQVRLVFLSGGGQYAAARTLHGAERGSCLGVILW